MEKEQIERINELARKKKTVGLTEAEVKEQAELRAEYLKDFREGFRQQLDKLFRTDAIDISSDIEVLETMMARDGLTGSAR